MSRIYEIAFFTLISALLILATEFSFIISQIKRMTILSWNLFKIEIIFYHVSTFKAKQIIEKELIYQPSTPNSTALIL